MINFSRFTTLYFVISALIIIPGVYSLVRFGLKPAIDFTGGSLLEVAISASDPNEQQINEALSELVQVGSVQKTGNSYLIRTKPLDQETYQKVQVKLIDTFGSVTQLRFETIGPVLGKELLTKTLTAIVIAIVAILFYVGYQFRSIKFGVCAVIAMLHDVLIVTGVFSLLGNFYQVQVDTLFVTAILTVLSFSIHDTIVVYDRIRESLHRFPKATFEDIVNKSIWETLGRSINNSMTIIFMLVALFLLGGETIRWFVFALLIGTMTGTYSSTFTAVPLLVVWERLRKKVVN